MTILTDSGILIAAYLIGSIPFGLIVVKLISGKDIRRVASGRTGGTNAMRAAGVLAGVFTALLDILKAAAVVWLAKALSPNVWMHTFAPVATILGHNWSIFLAERSPAGRFRLRGGAGGAAAGGGSFGLWAPAGFILVSLCGLIWFGLGYASITTLSVGLLSILLFGIRAALGLGPWQYVIYALLAETIMAWSLRSNLQRLKNGTERRHGLPVILQQRREAQARQKKAPNVKLAISEGED